MAPINRRSFNLVYRDLNEWKGRKILRWLTLNGFLIPGFLIKEVVVYQHKGVKANWRSIFRAKRVFYEYEPLTLGYVAEHDKRRFFIELFRFLAVIAKFAILYARLKKTYCDELKSMTSENFWRDVYSG